MRRWEVRNKEGGDSFVFPIQFAEVDQYPKFWPIEKSEMRNVARNMRNWTGVSMVIGWFCIDRFFMYRSICCFIQLPIEVSVSNNSYISTTTIAFELMTNDSINYQSGYNSTKNYLFKKMNIRNVFVATDTIQLSIE